MFLHVPKKIPKAASFRGVERRHWLRLPLSIPVFVRGQDMQGEDFLEFSVLRNISATGTLLAARRVLRRASRVVLEIPSAPVSGRAGQKVVKILRARVLWTTAIDGWNLYGLRFARRLK